MAINLTKIIDQIQTRLDDSTQSDRSIDQLIKIANRIDNSGTQILSYKSTGQLPSTADSAYVGTIAYVETDNVFGDSGGRFVFASGRDSGWLKFTTLQDSDEAAIEAPSSGGGTLLGQNVQGTAYGYMTAGFDTTYYNTIDKFSFASNANATDVGDTTSPGSVYEVTASPTHTYIVGGYTSPGTNISSLEKYSMVSDGNSADTGTPTPAERTASMHNGPGFGYQIFGSDIHKIVHTSDTFVDAAGTIPSPIETSPIYKYQGYSSTTHAYSGNSSPAPTDPFVKVAYANDTAAASSAQADQTYGDQSVAANFNSDVAGYVAGGNTTTPSNAITAITKFVFASEAEMTSVGTIAFEPAGQRDYGGCASTTYGYAAGGRSYTAPNSVATTQNTIHNTPFASDAPSSDVGDLTVARRDITPTQSQV